MKVFEFDELKKVDLVKGALYKGGPMNNLSSEPITKLLPVGNQGGIRFSGKIENPLLVVLYTTLLDIQWPDSIKGNIVTYFGDNKIPGNEIHDSTGNKILRSIFNNYHISNRSICPPIFLFSKGQQGFDRIFHGLIVPGYEGVEETEDLVAIWMTQKGQRFQNYRAIFTLQMTEVIKRSEFTF